MSDLSASDPRQRSECASVLTREQKERHVVATERIAKKMSTEALRIARARLADLAEGGKLSEIHRELVTIRGSVVHKEVCAREDGKPMSKSAILLARVWSCEEDLINQLTRLPKQK